MIAPVRIALAQINSRVGDLEGNAARINEYVERARDAGAEMVLLPELAICGYPPEDLLLKEHFLEDCGEALGSVAAATEGIVALVGFPERTDDVYNALAVISDGEIRGVYRKVDLPNYGVFDEQRYFQAGECGGVLELGDARIGLTICEDIWTPGPPASSEALAGAQMIANASASPYHRGKGVERERMLVQRARDNLSAIAFCNMVGGQDELVFDGHSLILDHEGNVIARAPQFAEALVVATVALQAASTSRLLEPEAEVYAALVTGTRDYVEKNGFEAVTLGLSGGIDSTLVLLIAVDALGPDRVTAVTMPSRYSSSGTRSDAIDLAENLGVRCLEIPIEPAFEAFEEMLAEVFEGRDPDLTEENLQARIRGNLLMALSNKFGWLVLTTGNKSETSVGYSTLYGDTAGGFAVIKDVWKTLVYRLVDFRDERDAEHPVPRSIVDRPPSAELRHDQKDADSLPDYDTLDAILELYIEHDASAEQIIARGLPADAVERIVALVDRNEYKRRQQPPGVRISPRAFGRDRRMPITNAYRG
jgi:NAD+ synthase (glutamine-hydrolysing)